MDGSEVKGKVLAKQDALKSDAIPWLLLAAASHTGEGVLSRVTSIQRNSYRGWAGTGREHLRCFQER